MDEVPTTRIVAPHADLTALSFCETTVPALAEWVIALPMANTPETAAQVRQATWELARLDIAPQERMDLLEQVRPVLHYLCTRLDRNAATSAAHGDAIARLAQRLQTNLCAGYKSVVVASLAQRGGRPWEGPGSKSRRPEKEVLPLAIHRALSDLSRTLLRTLQFYVAPADRLWFELNQLFLLAERLGVADMPLEDAENHATPMSSSTNAYLRSLLLACCKPNQMRYRHLAEVFNCLEMWSQFVTLEPDATSALFAVDLESDQGPIYKHLIHDAVEPRGIRTDVLVYQLESYLRDLPSDIRIPGATTEPQLRHLAQAWGEMQPRSHRRTDASGTIKVCVGLRSAHYFLSGGVEFNDLLDDPDALINHELNPFLLDRERQERHRPMTVKDVWDDAFDVRGRIPENPNIEDPGRIIRLEARRHARADERPEVRSSHEIYDTSAIDTSPSGYQIRWNDPLPPQLQTGEILALRETADNRWCVALIRWIRQNQEGTSMGIELLAPRAIPAAARVIQKVGGPTTYARALLLPELTPIGQPATLITPRLPFQAGQKIHLKKQGVRSTAQLTKCVLRTESVNQFTYRMLAGYLENAHPTLKMDEQ